MKALLLASLLSLISGFGIAWNWQSQRWNTDVATIRQKAAESLASATQERDRKLAEAESKKEEIQNAFEDFKRAEDKRNNAIDHGAKRVYVRASCPAVPSSKGDSSGASGGAAELDISYRRTLSQLRSGVEEQRRLLNICRAELGIDTTR